MQLGNQAASAAEVVNIETLADGLANPASVAATGAGEIYVSNMGKVDRNGDGSILLIDGHKRKPFATGLDDPRGLVAAKDKLFVADKQQVWQIDAAGKATVLAAAKDFPQPPKALHDIAIDEAGTLYVSDRGDGKESLGAIFAIDPAGKVRLVASSKTSPKLKAPGALILDDKENLLALDTATGELHRVNLASGKSQRVAGGFDGATGLARDASGKLYVSQTGIPGVFGTPSLVSVLGKESLSPQRLPGDYQGPADLCLSRDHKQILIPDTRAGTLTAITLTEVPAVQVDESPLPLAPVRMFPELTFNRPLVLTHAGDGTNRVFVASQLGKVHVFANSQTAAESKVFLDLEKLVTYKETENEEGLLGLAFHPKYKQNGLLYAYYTTSDAPHTSVVAQFKVSSDDPDRVDPKSRVELMRIPQPFWNHNGGTLAFGPDGYLYIALGDGGKANDPFGNGQNLRTLLGSVLRIDVDHQQEGLPYAIPKDNPFVDYPHARPEIWAYGLRNPWRMSFDRQTGELLLADVGQDLWEEVNIVTGGANCGWSLREGQHPFGIGGVQQPREDLLEPIFEYSHDIGKSITGGHVYRGKQVPQLSGAYLYADYVTGKLYALKYDPQTKTVLSNRPIPGNIEPVFSFGEDEAGEVYFMTTKGWIMGYRAE